MTLTATTLMLLLLTILCTSAAQVMQKQAANELSNGTSGEQRLLNTSVVISMGLLGLGMGLWLLVLKRLDVSLAYPLLSANFIVVHLLAYWKFGESIPTHRIIGSLIIIAGMVCLFSGTPQ